MDENYVYTFDFDEGEILDQTALVRDGYTYKLYIDDVEVQTIIIEGDVNVKVVYSKIEDEPIQPDDSSNTSSDVTDSGEKDSGSKGCFGVVSLDGMGVMLMLSSAVVMLKKKKKD